MHQDSPCCLRSQTERTSKAGIKALNKNIRRWVDGSIGTTVIIYHSFPRHPVIHSLRFGIFLYSLGVQIPFQQAFGCPGFSDKWMFLELFNGEFIVRSMPIPWGSCGLRWKFDVTVLVWRSKGSHHLPIQNRNQGQILAGTVEQREFFEGDPRDVLCFCNTWLPFAATKGWKLLFIQSL